MEGERLSSGRVIMGLSVGVCFSVVFLLTVGLGDVYGLHRHLSSLFQFQP